MPPQSKEYSVKTPKSSLVVVGVVAADSNLSEVIDDVFADIANAIPIGVTFLLLVDRRDEAGSRVIEISHGLKAELEAAPELFSDAPGAPSAASTITTFFRRALASFEAPDLRLGLLAGHGDGIEEPVGPNAAVATVVVELGGEAFALVPTDPWNELVPSLDDWFTAPLGATAFVDAIASALGSARLDGFILDSCFDGTVEVHAEFARIADSVVAPEGDMPTKGLDYAAWFETLPDPPGSSSSVDAMKTLVDAFAGSPRGEGQSLAAFGSPAGIVVAFERLVDVLTSRAVPASSWVDATRNACARARIRAGHDTFDLAAVCRHLAMTLDLAEAQAVVDAIDEAALGRFNGTNSDFAGLSVWLPPPAELATRDLPLYSGLEFDRRTRWRDYLRGAF